MHHCEGCPVGLARTLLTLTAAEKPVNYALITFACLPLATTFSRATQSHQGLLLVRTRDALGRFRVRRKLLSVDL